MISRETNHRQFPRSLRAIRRGQAAFTLIELLCVLALVGIIIGIAVSAPNLWRSTDVTVAGNTVMEDLAYARELAIANNEPTEVWFLQPTGGTSFLSSQIYTVDQSGNSSSYGTVHHLPANLMMDSGSFLSPLFTSGNQKSFSGSQAQPWIPGYGTSYQAWFVRFMPDGSTTLSTSQQWYLTLHDVSLGDQLKALPANYAMISLDPMTGAVSLYRP
jgi:uncharacterized protein (TIGR02596 family)